MSTFIVAGGALNIVEERNYVEAPSWEVRLQVNVVLNGSGLKTKFDLSSWKVGNLGFIMIGIMSWNVRLKAVQVKKWSGSGVEKYSLK